MHAQRFCKEARDFSFFHCNAWFRCVNGPFSVNNSVLFLFRSLSNIDRVSWRRVEGIRVDLSNLHKMEKSPVLVCACVCVAWGEGVSWCGFTGASNDPIVI